MRTFAGIDCYEEEDLIFLFGVKPRTVRSWIERQPAWLPETGWFKDQNGHSLFPKAQTDAYLNRLVQTKVQPKPGTSRTMPERLLRRMVRRYRRWRNRG